MMIKIDTMLLTVVLILLAPWHLTASVPPLTAPAYCPPGCRCDLASTPRSVDCSGLKLATFPEKLHPSTQYLDLSFNNIKSLPSHLSQLVPQLETLLLHHNSLQTVLSDSFKNLPELRTLDLSDNLLSGSPPSRLIGSNPRILDLRLSNNPALQTPGHLHSSCLEILDFSGCNITRMNSTSFLYLPALRSLNLSNNPLTNLPDNLTSPSLRILDLTQCRLTSLPPGVLTTMPKIQHLHIANNPKLDLPRNPPLISKSLLQLTADHCNIQHASISNLKTLTHAYLSCNKISALKRENFAKNSALLEIDLRQNLIRELPVDVFLYAVHLVSVDLSSNHIESLQYDSFSCCEELKFLNLSRNDITKLPEILTMPAIEVFDLSRCRISSIPNNSDFLNSMNELRQLYLHHNEIEDIPDLISKSLKQLDLSYCHLTHITNDTFKKLNELQRLDLSGNRMTSLNADVFITNKKLGTLYLENNPWRCNCSDPEFISLYDLADQLSETGRNELKCNDPEELSGQSWELACKDAVNENDAATNWLLSITLFMTLVALAGVMMCTKKVVGSGHKTRQRRTRTRPATRQDSESSNDDDPIRPTAVNPNQCTPCSEAVRNQRILRIAAETQQPPTYEEAVLMPRSLSNINIQIEVTNDQLQQVETSSEEEEVETQPKTNSSNHEDQGESSVQEVTPEVIVTVTADQTVL